MRTTGEASMPRAQENVLSREKLNAKIPKRKWPEEQKKPLWFKPREARGKEGTRQV